MSPQLALGTVQFGLAYGAVGSGQAVADDAARAILQQAWADGVRVLDTAATYGDIEARLAGLCGPLPFRIVSKITPLGTLPAAERPAALAHSMRRSIERLGDRLQALLFHSAADLLAADGPALWAHARSVLKASGRPLQLGVSVYAPSELLTLRQQLDITIAQLPGNALDQRLHRLTPDERVALDGVELHLRSAFLQGLLLAPERGAQRVPAAAAALTCWQQHCDQAGLPLADAALGVVKGLPRLQQCVVGVESLAQWQDVAAAWHHAQPLHWPTLASDDADACDPRRWPPA